MLALLIGLAIRQSRAGGGIAPPPFAPALLAESGSHVLTETGGLLLLE